MWLEYDKQLRMSEKIDADKYTEAIQIIYPESKSTLGKQIEMTKSMVDILEYADTALGFNPRTLVSGGADLAKEIIVFSASLFGLPSSVADVAKVTNYIPKATDVLSDAFKDIDDTLYSTLWGELRDTINLGGDEDDVMAYDAKNNSVLAAFMEGDGALVSDDMMHNLKLIFLKNIHFKQHKDTYLQNLITTIRYYHEAKEKSVIVRPLNNHESYFIRSVNPSFRSEFKATPRGYSQDSFLGKNPRVTLSYDGVTIGLLKFKEKDEKGNYTTEDYDYTTNNILSFATAGDYVINWKYQDDTGIEKNGKLYVKFVNPHTTSITDYKINTNYIDNTEGFIKATPIFSSTGYIEYDMQIKLGNTTLEEPYNTGIKIPNYADRISGKLGTNKLNELKNAKIRFLPKKSSSYTFEPKEFEINLLDYSLNGDENVFDSTYIEHKRLSDSAAPAVATIDLYIGNPDVKPIAIDFEDDGIYDKTLINRSTDDYSHMYVSALYRKKGFYKPCVNFRHIASKLEKRICEEYAIKVTGEDEPPVAELDIPELKASRTQIKVGFTVTFMIDMANIDSTYAWDTDYGGTIVSEAIANGKDTIIVEYHKQGVFFPYVEVVLTDGKTVKIKSKPIKVDVEDTTGTITHNGTTYGTVTSPYTGKVWLDRNLGASQVCTAYNDTACYGDYYQWGRNYDGHQDSDSPTTTIQATDVNNVGHGDFIDDGYSFRWASVDNDGSLRSTNWSKTDGTSVCPRGFRVPTRDELQAEFENSNSLVNVDFFNNFLKFPIAGKRSGSQAFQPDANEEVSGIWTSSADYDVTENVVSGGVVYFGPTFVLWTNYNVALGFTVRCLRD